MALRRQPQQLGWFDVDTLYSNEADPLYLRILSDRRAWERLRPLPGPLSHEMTRPVGASRTARSVVSVTADHCPIHGAKRD